jgi:hypothetical protein
MGEELTRLSGIRMSRENLRVKVKLADNAHHATGAQDSDGLTDEAVWRKSRASRSLCD